MRLTTTLPVPIVLFILASLELPVNASHSADNSASPAQAYSATKRAHPHASSLHHDLHSGSRLDHALELDLRADGTSNGTDDVVCHPAGRCEPCPEDEIDEPYCQPFGNRRLVHCYPRGQFSDHELRPPPLVDDAEGSDANDDITLPERPRQEEDKDGPPHHNPATKPPDTSLPAYESCGRIVEKERADFFEFVLTNVIFAALAVSGVLIRSERMRTVRARRLAARIGVGLRRASGSWRAVGGSLLNQTDTENERLMAASGN